MKLTNIKIGTDEILRLQAISVYAKHLLDNVVVGRIIGAAISKSTEDLLVALTADRVELSKEDLSKGKFLTLSRVYLELMLVPLLDHFRKAVVEIVPPDRDYLVALGTEIGHIASWFNIPEDEATSGDGLGVM